jgi:hypothetical protein
VGFCGQRIGPPPFRSTASHGGPFRFGLGHKSWQGPLPAPSLAQVSRLRCTRRERRATPSRFVVLRCASACCLTPRSAPDPLRQAVLPAWRAGLCCTTRASRPASAVGVSSNVRPHQTHIPCLPYFKNFRPSRSNSITQGFVAAVSASNSCCILNFTRLAAPGAHTTGKPSSISWRRKSRSRSSPRKSSQCRYSLLGWPCSLIGQRTLNKTHAWSTTRFGHPSGSRQAKAGNFATTRAPLRPKHGEHLRHAPRLAARDALPAACPAAAEYRPCYRLSRYGEARWRAREKLILRRGARGAA